MTDNRAIAVSALHYRLLSALGLGLLCLGQYWQEVIDLPNAFLGFLGLWMILFPRPRVPMTFVVLACVVQFFAHFQIYQFFRFSTGFVLFEPTTLALAAGLLIFLVGQYRLIAIKWHVTPYDPRFFEAKSKANVGRPIVPLTRPESALTPNEIVHFVVLAAVWVLIGQWAWHSLSQNWLVDGINPRFMQVAFVIWIGVIGLFIGAGIVGYWRRAHSDPALAKMYLLEIDWQEARREYGRIGRWIAWGKRKMARKKPVG